MMRTIIPVVSGKGGVGKSTVAANLAIALAQKGAQVALVDSDFYGPSVPTLFGGGEVQVDHEKRLIPPKKFGVKYISLGFFLKNPDDPVIWRGPMFNKALTQLFHDVNWGEVDYCIVDMPPGTGDAQLSLAQLVKITGAIVVTTPQEVALADVRKAMNMLKTVNVPILGIVENMAGFRDSSGEIVPLFGEGGGEKTAKEFGVPLLAQIPLDIGIRKGGDEGNPVAFDGGNSAVYFHDLAARIIEIVDALIKDQPQLSIVN
jgi:ATP-binding protein involved in chromosome partitioning